MTLHDIYETLLEEQKTNALLSSVRNEEEENMLSFLVDTTKAEIKAHNYHDYPLRHTGDFTIEATTVLDSKYTKNIPYLLWIMHRWAPANRNVRIYFDAEYSQVLATEYISVPQDHPLLSNKLAFHIQHRAREVARWIKNEWDDEETLREYAKYQAIVSND